MPAQSDTSICNLALTILSSSRIEDLLQENENARKCNAVYTFLRNDLLSHHNWNFARKESTLARLDEEPVLNDWSYVYQIPSDCIRVIFHKDNYPFMIFEDKLYSNQDTAYIYYASIITDSAKFPPYFANALAYRIAATLAFGITQNATLAEGIAKAAMVSLKEAIWTDSQEGEGNKRPTQGFMTARQVRQ